MNYNKSYQIGRIGIVTGIFIILLGMALGIELFLYIGLIVIIGSAVQESIFYRCPNCNESLSIRGKRPKHCPECGFKLDE